MFKRFFHKKKPARTFELLHDSPIKERYFIRTAQWDWLDHEHIAVVDPNSPRMLTMDPWPQWIFLDGFYTRIHIQLRRDGSTTNQW